jgi:hypothetical protein
MRTNDPNDKYTKRHGYLWIQEYSQWFFSTIQPTIYLTNCICGEMVSVLASSAVNCWFKPQSCRTKNYKIGICFFSAKHAVLRSKSNDWLAIVCATWNDLSIYRLLFQWGSTIKSNWVRWCHLNVIEDEEHFFFHCQKKTELLRKEFLTQIENLYPKLMGNNHIQNLDFFFIFFMSYATCCPFHS